MTRTTPLDRLPYEELTYRELVERLGHLKVGDLVDVYTETSGGSNYRAEVTQASYDQWLRALKANPDDFTDDCTSETNLRLDIVEQWSFCSESFIPYNRTVIQWPLDKVRTRDSVKGPRYGLTRFLSAHEA